jgi:hypothetical protein
MNTKSKPGAFLAKTGFCCGTGDKRRFQDAGFVARAQDLHENYQQQYRQCPPIASSTGSCLRNFIVLSKCQRRAGLAPLRRPGEGLGSKIEGYL